MKTRCRWDPDTAPRPAGHAAAFARLAAAALLLGAAAGPLPALAAKHATSSHVQANCANCGTVVSVQAVRQKGRGTGVGAVGGAIVGGVVGHQFGGGSGRDAMTALGAVGGGIAGHEIEKNYRSKTVYAVRVRMDDGAVRTFTREHPPARGARVAVEGERLRVIRTARGAAPRNA